MTPCSLIHKRIRAFGYVLLVTTTACDSGAGKVVYAGGTLWNGTGAPPILDAVVIVSDGHIEAAGPPDLVAIPRNAEVRRVDGRWIIPGLIDAHAHIERWMMPALLASGVTAVRGAGGDVDSVIALRDDALLGSELAPRLFISGAAIDAVPARPTETGVSNATEARRAIDQLVLIEAAQAMISPKITRALLVPLMDEANSLLVPVMGHLGKIDAIAAAGLGVQAIDHLSGVVEASVSDPSTYFRAHSNFYAGWKMVLQGWNSLDSARIDRTARSLADAGVIMIPTLHYHEAFSRLRDQQYIASLDLSTVPEEIRQGWNITQLIRDARLTGRDHTAFRRARPRQNLFVRRFRAAGGILAAGSNAPETLMAPGTGLHAELQQLVRAGLSTKDALLAATRDAARLLTSDSLGIIEPGAVADFIVLTADPLVDIANAKAIEFIVFKGERHYPEDFAR
jgi:imidazolonepropionase-like amidohydrolase